MFLVVGKELMALIPVDMVGGGCLFVEVVGALLCIHYRLSLVPWSVQ